MEIINPGAVRIPTSSRRPKFDIPVAAFDVDALAFFAKGVALGESPLSTSQKSAVNAFVVSSKSAGLWAKYELCYPFVGGTAVWNSLNLKSPNTFQIAWAGTLTHDANGVTGNGSTGWGDTGWASASASIATLNSVSVFAYCRTVSPTDGGRFLGVSNTLGTSRLGMVRTGSLLNSDGPHDGTSDAQPSINTITPDFSGTMLVSRTAAAVKDNYIRGSTDGDTTASFSACTGLLAILARNFETFGPDSFSNANLALAGAGSGFSAADYAAFNTIVINYQTALGRNV